MASNLVPGTQKYGEIDPAIHITKSTGGIKQPNPVASITQDPCPPVEYGRTAAASQYETTNSSGAPIPDQTPAPPPAP
jgi:hypothetical protein